MVSAYVTDIYSLSDKDRKKIEFFDAYINHVPIIFFLWNASNTRNIEYVSDNINQFGYSSEQFLLKQISYADIIHPDDILRVLEEIETYFSQLVENFHQTYRIVTADGRIRWVTNRAVNKRDSDQYITHYMWMITDITEKKDMEREIFESTSIFRSITDDSTIGFFICQNHLIYANRAIQEISGFSKEELYGRHVWDFAYEEADKKKLQNIIKRRCHGEIFHSEYNDIKFLTKNKEIKFVRITSDTIRYLDGWAAIGTIVDITDIVETKKQVNILAKAVERTNDMIRITDSNGLITFVNDATVEKTGYLSHELIGKTPRVFKSGHHTLPFYQDLWQVILSGKTYHGIFQNKKKDGTIYHEAETITPILDPSGSVEYFIVTSKDISERIQLEQQLYRQATTDMLTGLSNRQKFINALELELERFNRYGTKFAIVMIDIDHFKNVNDQYGHDMGDKVLTEVSQILLTHIRKNDILARWGGEEFILLSAEMDGEKTVAMAKKLKSAVENSTFGTIDHLTISLGATISKEKDTIQTIIKRADEALYRSKDNGRNQVQFIHTDYSGY